MGTLRHMGGAERQAVYLVEHLSKLRGCTVEVLAFEDGEVVRKDIEALGVPVHVLQYYYRWKPAKRALSLAQLAWLLRTGIKPDALLPFVGVHSKTAAQVWPFSGARYCWWNQQDEGRDLTGTEVERRLLNRVSCITSNSFAGQDFLFSTYGVSRESILVYNNGTPMPEKPPFTGWRTRLKLGSRKIVTMIANITRFKDHDTLLDAWVLVREHFSGREQPVLLLAGHLREQATVAGMKMKAYDHGFSSRDIIFLGPVNDVAALIAESDLVVHSSIQEGCPNAVCEAMALGLPVVATDIPGCRQALGDSEVFLAKPKDPHSLACKLIGMLEDEGLRKRAGEANGKRIATDFTMEGMNRFFQTQIERGLGCSLS